VLSTPAAVAHPKWPALVKKVIGLSWTYGDVTKVAYGQRLGFDSLEEDEGGAMETLADDHLYTFDWVLTLLATPAAVAHPKWEALLLHLCDAKRKAVSYYSFGDAEVAKLLAQPHVKKHKAYKRIVAAARKAFPYASRV
jgi:hypothetical protein